MTLARFRFGKNRLERKTIELGDVRHKYLQITWTERPPLPVTGIRGEFATSGWIEPQRHQTSVTARRESAREFRFDKPPVPADRLGVRLPEVNTLVRVELHSRTDDKAPCRLRASGLQYRIRAGEREITSEPLTFSPTPDRFWKLVLVGADASLGAANPEVTFHWVAHQLFFLAQGASPFLLAYGQSSADAADFGVGSVTAAFDATDAHFTPAVATLGNEQRMTAEEPSSTPSPGDRAPGTKYFLWALLAGGVLLSAWMAVKLLRDLKESS